MSAVIQDNPESSASTGSVPLAAGAGTRTLLFDPAGGPVSLARFLAQVRALAARLPEGSHAINLCEDRHRFMLAFCAAALRGQATLLPPSRAPAEIAREAARHADSYCLGDLDYDQPPPRYWQLPARLDDGDSAGDGIPDATSEATATAGDSTASVDGTSAGGDTSADNSGSSGDAFATAGNGGRGGDGAGGAASGGDGAGGAGGSGGTSWAHGGAFDMSNSMDGSANAAAGVMVMAQNSGASSLIQQGVTVQANLSVGGP